MYDKSLLATREGEVWVGKEGSVCEGTMFLVVRGSLLFLFVGLKCLVEFDCIPKHTVPCAQQRFAVEHCCETSSSKSVVRRSVRSMTRGIH